MKYISARALNIWHTDMILRVFFFFFWGGGGGGRVSAAIRMFHYLNNFNLEIFNFTSTIFRSFRDSDGIYVNLNIRTDRTIHQDQTASKQRFDQGLYCLPFRQRILDREVVVQ